MCGHGEDEWGPDSPGSPGPDQHAGGQHRVPGRGCFRSPNASRRVSLVWSVTQ